MFNNLLKQYEMDVLDPDISSMIYEAVKRFFKNKRIQSHRRLQII